MFSNKILCVETGLKKNGVAPEDIKLLVSTHGHSDHIGNNNLFLKAKHIVGFSVSYEHKYFDHSFLYGKRRGNVYLFVEVRNLTLFSIAGEELIVDDFVKVIATPGHTMSDVSVLVQTEEYGLVAITGKDISK